MLHEKTLDLRAIHRLIIAGWTGQDTAALEKHIRELEAIGVPRPKPSRYKKYLQPWPPHPLFKPK